MTAIIVASPTISAVALAGFDFFKNLFGAVERRVISPFLPESFFVIMQTPE